MTSKSKYVFKPLLISLSIATAFVAGCGGGGTGSSPGSGSVATSEGQFVDSPVQGLRYDAGSGVKGETNASGTFRYIPGRTVTFFINDIPFGTAEGSQIITPFDLARYEALQNQDPNDDNVGISSPGLLNRLIFLQGIDDDGNPNNGISITTAAESLVGQTVNFVTQNAQQLLISLAGSLSLPLLSQAPNSVDALTHFESYARANLFHGCYRGSMTGVGNLAVTVATDGDMYGNLTDSQNVVSIIQGTMRGDGSFTLGPVGQNAGTIIGRTVPLRSQAVAALSFGNATGSMIMRRFDPLPPNSPPNTPDPSLSNTSGCPVQPPPP